jgi:N-acetylglutamate synthase-like GNAT family acetyltransferase
MINVTVKAADINDLKGINQIITACVYSWDLPDRVKRLTLQSYLYDETDFDHLDIFVATDSNNKILGLAALESAQTMDLPGNQTGLLLHGIYVDPHYQNQHIGEKLLSLSFQHVKDNHLKGLLVKAQASANSYFGHQGFEHLPVINPDKDYPHRWWKLV